MSTLLLAILFFVLVYLIYAIITGKPPNTPPGIPWLPFFGSYWFLLWGNYNFPHETLRYYTKKLNSKMVSAYLGNFFTVIINDPQTVKEVLSRAEFDGRVTDLFIIKARAFGKKLGIFFTDGEQWKEQRRFTLRHMRDFGFGKRHEKLESEIAAELRILIDMLKDGPVNDDEKLIVKKDSALFPDVLYASLANNIWGVMFGEKFDRTEHDKMRSFSRAAITFQRSGETTGGALVLMPQLRFFGDMFGYKSLMKGGYDMIDLVKEYLRNRKRTYKEDTEKGFVDTYLKRLDDVDEASYFSEEQLIMALTDFMFPATSAVSSAITHAIKYCMHNPDVTKKIQSEIDSVVGTGRIVTWEDRKNLPYTEATVREALRIETITPFSVFHRATKDTTLGGYSIPMNTVVITNLAGMNRDPDFWGDPDNFRPDRFLDEDGQLIKDPTLPFGFGHRVCAGETFARYNLFGTFAALMQNFDFSFIDGEPTGLEDKLPGLIVTPKETWIGIRPRT